LPGRSRALILWFCLACLLQGPALAYRLAVLSEPGFPPSALSRDQALSPQAIGAFLADFCQVNALTYKQAADPDVLTTAQYEGLLLPYGGNFPLYLMPTLLHFARLGGDLFFAQGAPLLVPFEIRDGRWMQSPVTHWNASGYYYNGLRLQDFRNLGLFAYLLPPNLHYLVEGEKLATDSARGFAVGAATSDRLHQDTPVARNFPLLWVRDKYATVQVPTAVLVKHFAGEFQDSNWVLLGTLGKANPLHPKFPRRKAFWNQLFTDLASPAFAPTAFALPAYYPGERARCTVKVRNFTPKPTQVQVRFHLKYQKPPTSPSSLNLGEEWQPLQLLPTNTAKLEVAFKVSPPINQYVRLEFELADMEGRLLDEYTVTCWVLGTAPAGPKLVPSGSFCDLDRRTRLLFGAAYTGPVDGCLQSKAAYNLSSLQQDLQRLKAAGAEVLALHTSRFQLPVPETGRSSEPAIRLDLARLAAARQAGFAVQFCTQDDTLPLSDYTLSPWLLDQAALARQLRALSWYALRFPGTLFDPAGDAVFLQSPLPLLAQAFRPWLKQRYGTFDKLQTAWNLPGDGPSAFEQLAVPPEPALYRLKGQNLTLARAVKAMPTAPSPAQHDFAEFAAAEWRKFYQQARQALKDTFSGALLAGDTACNTPDFALGQNVDLLDMPARRFSLPGSRLIGALKLWNWRATAKPAWVSGLARTPQTSLPLHLQLTAASRRQEGFYEAAGALALNVQQSGQIWRQYAEANNLWEGDEEPRCTLQGLLSKAGVAPKGGYYALREFGLLSALTTPKAVSDQVVLVLPDSGLASSWTPLFEQRLQAVATALAAAGIDFTPLPASALDRLPPTTRLVLVPLCWGLSDTAWHNLLACARSGCTVYLSGLFTNDEYLLPRRQGRWKDLGLPSRQPLFTSLRALLVSPPVQVESTWPLLNRLVWQGHPVVELPSGGKFETLAQTIDGKTALLSLSLGSGKLLYAPDPLEFYLAFEDQGTLNAYAAPVIALYRALARETALPRLESEPESELLCRGKLHFEAGEGFFAFLAKARPDATTWFSTGEESPQRFAFTLGKRTCRLALRPGSTALAVNYGKGGPFCLMVDGFYEDSLTHDRLTTKASSAVYVLALDKQPLSSSAELVIIPRLVLQKEHLKLARSPHSLALEGAMVGFQAGKLKILAHLKLKRSSNAVELVFGPDETHQMLLLGEKGNLEATLAKLASLLGG